MGRFSAFGIANRVGCWQRSAVFVWGVCAMWRFIVVTFGALFLAFYEMSGGADYQPAEGSRQALAAAAQVAEAPKSLALRTSSSRPTAARALAPSGTNKPVVGQAPSQQALSGGSENLVLASAGGRAGPQPAKPAATLTALKPVSPLKANTLTALKPKQDLRQISGNSVNLRRGPGTRFNVVGRLSRGDSVQVLSQEGTWVKLRVTESGRIGYVADFLLSDPN